MLIFLSLYEKLLIIIIIFFLQSSSRVHIYLQLKVQNIMTETFALYEISC